MASFGFGIGLDYGGLGVNFTTHLHENIAIFGGVGYLSKILLYNTGVKARLISKKKLTIINPFVLGMYGVNTIAKFDGSTQSNSLYNSFKGFTFGGGIDFSLKQRKTGFWSLALLVPIRSTEYNKYVESIKWRYNARVKKDLLPIGFSIGYKIIFHTKTVKKKVR